MGGGRRPGTPPKCGGTIPPQARLKACDSWPGRDVGARDRPDRSDQAAWLETPLLLDDVLFDE